MRFRLFGRVVTVTFGKDPKLGDLLKRKTEKEGECEYVGAGVTEYNQKVNDLLQQISDNANRLRQDVDEQLGVVKGPLKPLSSGEALKGVLTKHGKQVEPKVEPVEPEPRTPDAIGRKGRKCWHMGITREILTGLYTGMLTTEEMEKALGEKFGHRTVIRGMAYSRTKGWIVAYGEKWKLTAEGMDMARQFLLRPGKTYIRKGKLN